MTLGWFSDFIIVVSVLSNSSSLGEVKEFSYIVLMATTLPENLCMCTCDFIYSFKNAGKVAPADGVTKSVNIILYLFAIWSYLIASMLCIITLYFHVSSIIL